MFSNTGKTLDIHISHGISFKYSNKAYTNTLTPKNIIKGLSSTAIYPLDRNIFDTSDFLCSSVTDHADPTKNLQTPSDSLQPEAIPGTSSNNETAVTPEAIRPFPKAPERKNVNNRGHKKGSIRVLTDTGEKKLGT